jgi:hypothetical protein
MTGEPIELRLMAVEAVALELVDRHGACAPENQDAHQSALWLWIAAECRAAREALSGLTGGAA